MNNLIRSKPLNVALAVIFILTVVSLESFAHDRKPVPTVKILSPLDGFTTDKDSLEVVVYFKAGTRPKDQKPTGKVKTVLLKLDDSVVAAHNNPHKIKEDTHTFIIDISKYQEGAHTLQAFAYKDKVRERLEGRSGPVSFIIKRGPPVPVITPQSGFIDGQVFDARTESPLENAEVSVSGVTGTVWTDAEGKYSFPSPGTGEFAITFNKEGYVLAQRMVSVVSTRDAWVELVFLTPIDPKITVITNAGGTHINSTGKVEITIPANALPQGTDSINVQATLYEHSRELPGPLPQTSFYTYALEIKPDGINFTQPVSCKLANELGFSAGTQIPIGLYNTQTLKWEDTGSKAVVSADGQWVEFQVTHFSYRDINYPYSSRNFASNDVDNRTQENNPVKQNCAKSFGNSLILLKSGDLILDHSLPSVRELNQEYGLTFLYNSHTANPVNLISVDTDLDQSKARIPATTTFKVNIEGRAIKAPYAGAPGKERYSYLYDCVNGRGEKLSTGSYPYTVEISNDYTDMTYATADYFAGPPTGDTGIVTREPVSLTTAIKGRISVNNQRDSAFGSGWSLNGLQRLHIDPDGPILLTEGDGSALTFKKQIKQTKNLAMKVWPDLLVVLPGTGDGTFQNTKFYSGIPNVAGGGTVFDGDFNRDGFTDLIIFPSAPNYSYRSFSVLLGNGDTTFQDPRVYDLGLIPTSSSIADFNNDGFHDLVITDFSGGGIYILLGNGDGTFQDTNFYPGLPGIWSWGSVSAADFNNDGFHDVAVANGGSHTVSVFLGKGDGTFGTPNIAYPWLEPEFIIAGDFNGDGFQDIIAGTRARNAWYSGGMNMLLGKGDGTFQDPITAIDVGKTLGGFAAGDFNDDGKEDLAVATIDNNIYVLLGKSDGTLQNSAIYPIGDFFYWVGTIVACDFNDDGFEDLSVITNGNNLQTLLSKGDGTFQSPTTYFIGPFNTPNRWSAAVFTPYDYSIYPEGAFIPPSGEDSHIIQNPDKTYTRFLKDGAHIIFNEEGLHAQTIDRNGNAITYDYADTNLDGKKDELSSITLPTGSRYQFTYDSRGKLSGITDPAGRVTGFSIDGQGNLTQIINPDGTIKIYVYDTAHLITNKTDERGFSAQYFYDQYGAIRMVISPEREVTEVAADGSVIQTRKQETRLYYPSDVKGLVNEPIQLYGTPFLINPLPVVRPDDMAAELIDGKGNNWTYRTNKFGGRLQFTDPLNNATTYERDPNSNLTKLTRANGSTVQMTYGERGNLYSIKEDYNSAETRLAYEPVFNQPTSIKDPLGNTTNIDYDQKGNPIQITDALSNITKLEYNPKGQVTKIILASGTSIQNETNFTYDAVTFNLLTVTDPLNNPTTFTYDTTGNIKTITDAEDKTATYNYDSMGRVVSVTDADGKTTTYSYDLSGNLISITDSNNHMTTFAYDEQSQLIRTTNALNQQRHFSYDVNRNLSLIITPNGDNIKFYYNKANIPEKKFTPSDTVNYSYDSLHNLTDASDSDSSLSFAYDPIGRLTQAGTNQTSVQAGSSISYTYDKNNNRTSLVITPTGATFDYLYDDLNRLTDITDTHTTMAHFDYDQLSRRITKTLPLPNSQQITSNYTYDAASQLLSIAHQPLSLTNSYVYDDAGNRTSLTDAYGLHNYSYDNLYRLTQAIHPNIPTENYSYDSVGNRLGSIVDIANRLADDGTFTYTYDNNGNMIKKTDKTTGEITNFIYDAEDRLIEGTVPARGLYLKYAYDPLGRRIQKNVNGTVTKYIYDNEDIIAEYDGDNNLTARYLHGPGIDEPVILDKNNNKYYYHTDSLGSVTALTDSNNNIVQSYQYDSFGNIVNTTGSLTQPYTYTGRELDPETGLYYYRARYYDPKIGRFLQEDPVWGVNLYSYVGNSPLNYIDPYGLWGVWFGGIHLGDNRPWLVFDNSSWYDFEKGAYATIDGIIPFGDPFDPLYDRCDENLQASKKLGEVGRDLLIVAAGLKTYGAATGIRTEFHPPHARGPHKYPHLQNIKGPGWGKTTGRWPSTHPWWWPK